MRQTAGDFLTRASRAAHPGLVLQRCLTRHDPAARRALFDAARSAAGNPSLYALYAQAFSRRSASLAGRPPSRSVRLTTAGRLVVGLGAANVLETGLYLHHTYGVPVIPGSALKGVASHYCNEIWGQAREEAAVPEECLPFRRGGKFHDLLFGTTEDGGVVTFHDAWLVPESLRDALRPDVMTPHHQQWQINAAPPTDFDSPEPVTFLSIHGVFDVAVSWCGPAGAEAEAWTTLSMTLLQEALETWGVGGKITSGYGRLAAARSRPSPQAPRPQPGQTVEAELLEERTKKGGWKACHKPSGMTGPIQNGDAVPPECQPGDKVSLIVASATDPAFRYPTAADTARAKDAPAKLGKPAARGSGGRRR